MVTPLQFTQERIDDEALHPVMDKITVVPNDEFESLFPKFQPSQVTITLADGTSFTERVDVPKGDPRDPMTEEEIAVKFTALGGDVVGQETCRALRTMIMSIEQEPSMVRLMSMMTVTTPAGV
jgi:2-methylcitrate dehydratase